MIDTEVVLRDLPQSAREIAEVIGLDRTLALIGRLKTTSDEKHGERAILYIPKKLTPHHPLIDDLNIGGKMDDEAALKAAQMLVQEFGGQILYPATCRTYLKRCRDNNIGEAVARGVSTSTVAEKVDMSTRQIRKIFAKFREYFFS